MKSNKKLMLLFLVLGFFFIAVNLIGNVSNSNNIDGIITDEENQENKTLPPEESWFNNNENPIYIDASATGVDAQNWTWARSQDWCQKGDGSYGNPYIIENVTIDATEAPKGSGIVINNSKNEYFLINNCTVYNSGTGLLDAGIKLENTNNGIIFNNTCSNNGFNGILLYDDCDYNTISGNNASLNYIGISLHTDCRNNTLSGNTANNNIDTGIYFYDCNYNNITGNTASLNNYGITLDNNCDNNTLSGNTVNDNSRYGITLNNNCGNNTLSGNTANDNTQYGIYLYNDCDDNTLSGNNASLNYIGIFLRDYCDNNTFSGNTANHNIDTGIYLETYCKDNTLSGNTASLNNYGITLNNNCDNNTLSGNTANNNTQNGIYLVNRITLCEIFDNTIINNTVNGLYLQLVSDWYVKDNLIYNNTFINNGDNALDEGSNNKWNNTLTGNYWDDYGGIDANDDGFGDNWYQITGSIYDKLPVWWDAPVVSIIFPSLNGLFGNDTIDYEITVERANLNDPDFNMWYVLDNGTIRKNATFTELTGTINYYLWNNFSTTFINITFYANDSRGWIGYMNVTIEKDLTGPIITIQKLGFFGASGSKALNFTIYRSGKTLDRTWYRIYNISDWTDNYTFSGLSSWIEQSLWDSLLNGTYTIQFFLNDSLCRLDFASGIIIKDIEVPILNITSPLDYDVVGRPSPNIQLNITEGNLHKIWYNLNNTFGNFTYLTEITSIEWEKLGHGIVTIRFWANDTAGNIAFGDFVILLKDLIAPIIDDINAPLSIVYGSTAPVYSIDITEPNFDYLYYTLYDGTHLLTSSPTTELSGSIDQGLWNKLNNGQINITFIVVDEGGNLGSDQVTVIREVAATIVPSDGGGGNDDGAEELFPWYGIMPWYIQAMVTGAISATVGIAIKMSYNRFRKKRN